MEGDRAGAEGHAVPPGHRGGRRRIHEKHVALEKLAEGSTDSSSRPSVEGGRSVGVVVRPPAGVVGAVVVEGAEELAVGEVGLPAAGPGLLVVVGFGLALFSRTGT